MTITEFNNSVTLNAIKTAVEANQVLLTDLKALAESRNVINQAILDLQTHIHVDHWHQANGGVPLAAILVNEYMGSQDLNGDGMIYGVDFHISPDCPERPPMLETFPTGGIAMTWPDYVGSL
jgi:hypothetical protein